MILFQQINTWGKKIILIIFVLNILYSQVVGQNNEIVIDQEYNNLSWKQFVEKIEKNYDIRFYYNPDSIPDILISVNNSPAGLIDVLNENLKDYDINASRDYLGLFNQEIVQAELKARGGDLGVKRTVKYRGAGLGPRKRYKKYGSEIDY